MCSGFPCCCIPKSCCGVIKKPEQIKGIKRYSDRSCTDLLFLFLFIGCWIAVISIFSHAQAEGGKPSRIYRGMDYLGRVCGKSEGVKDLPFAAFPYLLDSNVRICVKNCAETKTNENVTWPYQSIRFVFYCIPSFNGSIGIKFELSGDFESAGQAASRAMGDLFVSWPVILASAGVALVFAFMYVFFVEKCAGCIVWSSIILALIAGFVLSYALFERAKAYGDDEAVANRRKAVEGLGYACAVGTFVFLVVVISMRHRIAIAIAVIEDAAMAMNDMKCLTCFPLFPLLWALGFMVWWISVALWLFSAGFFKTTDIKMFNQQWLCTSGVKLNTDGGVRTNACTGVTPPLWQTTTKYEQFHFDEDLKKSFAVHFFSLLWNVEFLIYFTYLVGAGAVADWYFSRWARDDPGAGTKPSGDVADGWLSSQPIRDSCKRTCRFHLGTIAAGSLIIAVIEFIRALVKYVEEKTAGDNPNFLQKCVFKCIHCCLWCAQCCMDKINKNAFVWTAIYGDGFGVAVCSSFALVWRNLMRAAAVNLIGAYLMGIGKVVVALATTAACGFYLTVSPKFREELNSVVMPCVVIFVLAYLVASMFMAIFETVIDVTFFCFLVDEEANKATGNMFASKQLLKLVNEEQLKGHAEKEFKREMSRAGTQKHLAAVGSTENGMREKYEMDNTHYSAPGTGRTKGAY